MAFQIIKQWLFMKVYYVPVVTLGLCLMYFLCHWLGKLDESPTNQKIVTSQSSLHFLSGQSLSWMCALWFLKRKGHFRKIFKERK